MVNDLESGQKILSENSWRYEKKHPSRHVSNTSMKRFRPKKLLNNIFFFHTHILHINFLLRISNYLTNFTARDLNVVIDRISFNYYTWTNEIIFFALLLFDFDIIYFNWILVYAPLMKIITNEIHWIFEFSFIPRFNWSSQVQVMCVLCSYVNEYGVWLIFLISCRSCSFVCTGRVEFF